MPSQVFVLPSLTPCYRAYQQASTIIYFILQDGMKLLQVQTCQTFISNLFFFLEYIFLLDHFTNSYKALLLSPHIELAPLKNYVETYI